MGAMDAHFSKEDWAWWARVVSIGTLPAAMVVALFLFNGPGFKPRLRRQSLAERIGDLEAQGLLQRQRFQANRAFEVRESEDEGLHYFIELSDGQVLFLSGQYLYDYEAITDDPEGNRPRTFPCTEFEVLRHAIAGYVLEIRCSGTVLEPETTAPAFGRQDFERGIPEDGDVITDRGYDAIKAERQTTAD